MQALRRFAAHEKHANLGARAFEVPVMLSRMQAKMHSGQPLLQSGESRYEPANCHRDIDLDRQFARHSLPACALDPAREGIETLDEKGQENPATLARANPASVALEQPHAQMIFELTDLMTDRRLADTELFRRKTDARMPSRRLERPKRIEWR